MALIDMPAPPTMEAPTIAAPSTYDAALITPVYANQDQDRGTVAGQVKSIIDSYSPLMQQAEGAANRQMNARGLMNSSIGVGAAQGALYQAALPIAQADAASNNQFALTNAEIGNRSGEFNATSKNQAGQFNVGQENAFKGKQADIALDTAKTNLDVSSKTLWQQMDTDTKMSLAKIEADYKTLMQADASVGSVYQYMMKNIADINMNKDMNGEAKQAAVDAQINAFKQFANLTGAMNNLDVSQLLDFSGLTGGGGGGDGTGGVGGVTFPSNPSRGQTFVANGVTYTYTQVGTKPNPTGIGPQVPVYNWIAG